MGPHQYRAHAQCFIADSATTAMRTAPELDA